MFVFAGIASPSPDPITMLMLGGGAWPWWKWPSHRVPNDRREARLHPDPYEALADDQLSPIDLDETDTGSRLN